jgi:hypothetical protein
MAKPLADFHSLAKTHLAEVFRWSAETRVELTQMAIAGFGMAGPVMLGALNGHLALGLVASTGSLAIARIEIGNNFASQLEHLLRALAPAAVAIFLAILFTGSSWLSAVGPVLVCGLTALLSSFSRAFALVATRFVVFLLIVSALPIPTGSPEVWRQLGFFLLTITGAVWASILWLIFGTLLSPARTDNSSVARDRVHTATLEQKFARWKHTFTTLAGWSYSMRMTSSLALAAVMQVLWSGHHLHWVALTVAILTRRQVEPVPVKITQRAFGTALGVMLTSSFPRFGLPSWALILSITLLAGLRPLLRNRNYLAYSVVMTLIIVTIMDAGRTMESGVLVDRLLATLIGAGLVVGANLLFDKLSSSCLESRL